MTPAAASPGVVRPVVINGVPCDSRAKRCQGCGRSMVRGSKFGDPVEGVEYCVFGFCRPKEAC